MKAGLGLVISISVLLASAFPVFAHHSGAAEFDANKKIELDGVITKVEWTNPHARFYVDVKDASGNVTNWNFELGSPNVLVRQGWRRTALKEGDQVTVEGYMAKDGTHLANARRVTLPDGRKVFAGSAEQDGGPSK